MTESGAEYNVEPHQAEIHWHLLLLCTVQNSLTLDPLTFRPQQRDSCNLKMADTNAAHCFTTAPPRKAEEKWPEPALISNRFRNERAKRTMRQVKVKQWRGKPARSEEMHYKKVILMILMNHLNELLVQFSCLLRTLCSQFSKRIIKYELCTNPTQTFSYVWFKVIFSDNYTSVTL